MNTLMLTLLSRHLIIYRMQNNCKELQFQVALRGVRIMIICEETLESINLIIRTKTQMEGKASTKNKDKDKDKEIKKRIRK